MSQMGERVVVKSVKAPLVQVLLFGDFVNKAMTLRILVVSIADD